MEHKIGVYECVQILRVLGWWNIYFTFLHVCGKDKLLDLQWLYLAFLFFQQLWDSCMEGGVQNVRGKPQSKETLAFSVNLLAIGPPPPTLANL